MISRAVPVAVVLALAAGAPAAPAAAAPPAVDQMVVQRSGKTHLQSVRARTVRVRVAGGRRCRVPRATPLAALARSRLPRLAIRDFSRACDASSLFVAAIGRDRNRGQRGWVYKVGNRLATAGAASPSGPFGRGRLRGRSRVTWYYCVFRAGGCQRTLSLRARPLGDGRVSVRVLSHDDEGRRQPAAGARVVSGRFAAQTDAAGMATLTLPTGPRVLRAEKPGQIRSFGEAVTVR